MASTTIPPRGNPRRPWPNGSIARPKNSLTSVARADSTTGFVCHAHFVGRPHHYGQLFIQTTRSTIHWGDETHRPKLDYFRRDLVDGCLANHKTLPSTFLEIKTYINQATTTLMGADKVVDIWTLTTSPSKPSTHYAIDLWA